LRRLTSVQTSNNQLSFICCVCDCSGSSGWARSSARPSPPGTTSTCYGPAPPRWARRPPSATRSSAAPWEALNCRYNGHTDCRGCRSVTEGLQPECLRRVVFRRQPWQCTRVVISRVHCFCFFFFYVSSSKSVSACVLFYLLYPYMNVRVCNFGQKIKKCVGTFSEIKYLYFR
jgi:hypothetical protein